MNAPLCVLLLSLLQAAPPRPPPASAEPEAGPTLRLYTQRAFTKIRPGSLLCSRERLPRPPELRGPLQLRRDAELIKHYSRLAQLEVIAELGHRQHQAHLGERVDVVVRSETQRYYQAMQGIRQASWQAWSRGRP